MGRLTKEMKKAELAAQLEKEEEIYRGKVDQYTTHQICEMQRVDRRMERKRELIDRKYGAAKGKLEKERREKLKAIVKKYRRLVKKAQEETIDKVELAENAEDGFITLRQFLLNLLRERETGTAPNWKERITERSIEAKISTEGGTAAGKLRALQYEFESKFDLAMGQMPEPDVPAYDYLSKGKYIYLTEENCEFLKLLMGDEEDREHPEYDVIGWIKAKQAKKLDESVIDQIREGMYSLANNPKMKFDKSIIENRLTELFGTGSGKTEEALQSLIVLVNEMQSLPCTSEGQKGIFERVTKELDLCRAKVMEEYTTYLKLYGDEEGAVEMFLKSLETEEAN